MTQRLSSNQPDDDDLDNLKVDKIEIPVTRKLKKRAQAKAQLQGRSLTAIVRAWIMGWTDDEFHDPPNIADGVRAAPKRRKPSPKKPSDK